MLGKPDDINQVKIVDFGLARHTVNLMTTVCGTPQYVAPEVIKKDVKEYTKAVDMWGVGVIMFILLSGAPPFYDRNEAVMYAKIQSGKFSMEEAVWKNVSNSGKDMVKKLLMVDPKDRLTVGGALEHAWITGEVSSTPLEGARRNLENKSPMYKLKQAGAAVVVINRIQKEKEDLVRSVEQEDEADIEDAELEGGKPPSESPNGMQAS
eukprot:evm.model.scf_1755.2 EVM.evm.TU.scf_1755.2   scf_1755:33711-34629(-)